MLRRFIQHTSLHLTYPAPQSLSEIARIVIYLNVLSLNLHVPAFFLDYSVSPLDSPLFDRDRDGSLALLYVTNNSQSAAIWVGRWVDCSILPTFICTC